jgi:hypothetical protein
VEPRRAPRARGERRCTAWEQNRTHGQKRAPRSPILPSLHHSALPLRLSLAAASGRQARDEASAHAPHAARHSPHARSRASTTRRPRHRCSAGARLRPRVLLVSARHRTHLQRVPDCIFAHDVVTPRGCAVAAHACASSQPTPSWSSMASDVCPRRRSALLVSAHVGLLRYSVAELRTRSRGPHTRTRRRHSARPARPHRTSRSPQEQTPASLHGAGPSNTLNAAVPTASVFVSSFSRRPAAVSSPPHEDEQLSTRLSKPRIDAEELWLKCMLGVAPQRVGFSQLR